VDKYGRLQKRIAKKAKVPTKTVKSLWEKKHQDLIDAGQDPEAPLFIQDLTAAVKEKLGVKENFIALDRFKKFL
jgi:hypothetical protein